MYCLAAKGQQEKNLLQIIQPALWDINRNQPNAATESNQSKNATQQYASNQRQLHYKHLHTYTHTSQTPSLAVPSPSLPGHRTTRFVSSSSNQLLLCVQHQPELSATVWSTVSSRCPCLAILYPAHRYTFVIGRRHRQAIITSQTNTISQSLSCRKQNGGW